SVSESVVPDASCVTRVRCGSSSAAALLSSAAVSTTSTPRASSSARSAASSSSSRSCSPAKASSACSSSRPSSSALSMNVRASISSKLLGSVTPFDYEPQSQSSVRAPVAYVTGSPSVSEENDAGPLDIPPQERKDPANTPYILAYAREARQMNRR